MRALVFLLVIGLAACGPQPAPTPEPVAPPTVSVDPARAAGPAAAGPVALLAGRFCFFNANENITEGLDVHFDAEGIASGTHFGTIHNEAAAYFAAFETELSEGLSGEGGRVTFATYTEVDGDTQTGEETWVITPDSAKIDHVNGEALLPFACETLLQAVWPPMEE